MTALLPRFAAMLNGSWIHWPAQLRRSSLRSLRVQFSLGMLTVLVPSFALSYIVIERMAAKEISSLARDRLNVGAEMLAHGLREWGVNNRLLMKTLAYHEALRNRDVAGSNVLLRQLHELYPYRDWRYWSSDAKPRLLATSMDLTPEVRQRAEAAIMRRDYFQQALKGRPGYGVVKSQINNKACLMISQPVYQHRQAAVRAEPLPFSMPDRSPVPPAAPAVGQRPTGILVSCILLADLGLDTGLQRVLATPSLANFQHLNGDFSRNRPLDSAFVLISRHGHLLYPTVKGVNEMLPTTQDYERGYWGPLFRLANQLETLENGHFTRLKVGNDHYFVLVNKVDSALSSMMILNQSQVMLSRNILLHRLALFGIVCLCLASLAVYWQCGRIIAPIREVGGALRRISQGDFQVRLVHSRSDEIGQLFDDVNLTAEQLKLFLDNEMAHAVTQKQLETARVIQQDFLVSRLPVSPHLEIAPVSLPAYEVGADWYDAMTVEGVVYVVVADVCDKGIPSALYMSVFRSLLRFGLLAYQGTSGDPGVRLHAVVTRVNDYMARNHGDSMMFATVFVAAVEPEKGELHYISAGHEMPIICGSGELQSLPATGPALGLFEGAAFEARRLDLEVGAYLVAYSDGLTDARSPADVGWGHEALERFLQARRGGEASAEAVRDQLVAEVQSYMAGTDPFDDLTVMVLRRLA